MASRDIIILGGGGHASVVEATLDGGGRKLVGYAAPVASRMLEVPLLGDDSWLIAQDRSKYILVNGIGTVAVSERRAALFEKFTGAGFDFMTLVDGAASVSTSAVLSDGAQVLAGAVIGPHAGIGSDVIVNMSVSVNHHCFLGDHAHVAPGAVICGCVTVGRNSFIGAGATIIQGVTVGAGAMIAAGATVIRNVPDGGRVRGTPAEAF
jgi:UDP-perosamine 4-acetyltransferase